MFFARVEHYDFTENDGTLDYGETENEENEKNEEKKKKASRKKEENTECLICLEKTDPNLSQTQKFASIIEKKMDLFKECKCDCWVHDACLEVWISKKGSCIICRKYFTVLQHDSPSQQEEISISRNWYIHFVAIHVNVLFPVFTLISYSSYARYIITRVFWICKILFKVFFTLYFISYIFACIHCVLYTCRYRNISRV